MDLGLRGKVALVTASSKGLGKAVALALAAEGARVAMCARGRETLEAASAEIRAQTGAETLVETADVADPTAPARLVDAVLRRWGALHILVVNAGGPPPGTFAELPDAAWEDALRLNLLSAVRLCRAAVPPLKAARWGRILLMTSVAVKQPIDGLILSNTARAGVAGFAKTLAGELAPDGIRVNILCPGMFRTSRIDALAEARARKAGTTPAEEIRKMEAAAPVGRLGDPAEFGAVAAFLCGEPAGFITGAALAVDGGMCKSLL